MDVRYVANTAAVTSVSVTFSGTVTNNAQIVVYKFSGMAAASLEDSSVNLQDNSGSNTVMTSGALTTTNASDVLFYCAAVSSAASGFTVGSGYTIATNGTSNDRLACQYKVVAATQTGVTTSITQGVAHTYETAFAGFKGSGASTTVTGTFASTMNAGDTVVCGALWNDNTSTVSSFVDSKGNTYTQAAASPKTIAGLSQTLYYSVGVLGATAGADVVTVTLNASPSVNKLNCAEYSGISSFDSSAGATGTGTGIASGNVTTTAANDALVGVSNAASNITAVASGYTQRVNGTTNDLEDKPAAGAGAYGFSPTQTSASNWAAIVGAFKTGGVATTFTVTLSCGGAGAGTVAGSGLNASCNAGSASGTFSVVVNSGAVLNINATPASGSAFTAYSGAGCGLSPSCQTAAITANTSITANFTLSNQQNYYINISTGSDANSGLCAVAGTPAGCSGPWHSFSKADTALAVGSSGTTVHVASGTYASGINLTRGGTSSSVRVVYQCDAGVSDAITAIGKCIVTGSAAGFAISANNLDVVGFDIGNNSGMNVCFTTVTTTTTPSTTANSVHLVGNYCHDLGSAVSNSAGIVGCPEAGAFNIGNQNGIPSDAQILRNIVVRYGGTSIPVTGCNTAQGISGHANPFIVQDNLVIHVPVGGIVLHDACTSDIANNTVVDASHGVILGDVNGTCAGFGQNTFANNIFTNMFSGSSGVIFNVSGTTHCTTARPNLYSHNVSDNSAADFSTGPFSCETVTPSSFVHQTATSLMVNPLTNAGGANTFTGDYHLKSGSSAIDAGATTCVTGGVNPCVPSADFGGTSRPEGVTWDAGAYEFP
jgi:hypothetical protein